MDFSKLSPEQKQYALAIADKASEMGVDPDLALAVAFRESSFNPNALGQPIKGDPNRRAIGLMQIDPVNAKGLKMTIEDLADPEKNIAAGIQILRENLDRY
jgi:soluble lytic murein transglycosylase-like protein